MKFIKKFNELTNDKYNYLRLNLLELNQENMTIDITFVIPYEIFKNSFTNEDEAIIFDVCKQLLSPSFIINVKYIKTVLCVEIVAKSVRDFFKNKQLALLGQVDLENTKIEINEEKVAIKIPVKSHIFNYCKRAKIDEHLLEYLDSCYSAVNSVSFFDAGEFDISDLIKDEIKSHFIIFNNIETSCHQKLQGSEITQKAKFISDIKPTQNSVCVCGKVLDFKRLARKSNGKFFYTFKLDDNTGKIDCICFGRSAKKGLLDCVTNDQFLIIEGVMIEDTYTNGYKLKCDNVSYCKIDFQDMQERQQQLKIAQKKKAEVVCKEFEKQEELTLFDVNKVVHKFFQNRTYVVFDLETTGLSEIRDKIIEIGAVRIIDGNITDYFSTLIDPKIPIPPTASNINKIYDKDVEDAPYIEDVVLKFLDYCKGACMVAHNANFDMKFMRKACQDNGLAFDNYAYDTIELSKKAKPGRSRYTLQSMCDTYGIKNTNAHRAYFDAEATAQLFIKLIADLDLDPMD